MKRQATSPFPADFPSDLAASAWVHSGEPAWPPAIVSECVEWLGAHGYAVLGTEVLRPMHGSVQSLPYLQSVDRKSNEKWDEFVVRARAETLAYLRAFDTKFTEEGDVYVNLTWVSEVDFRS